MATFPAASIALHAVVYPSLDAIETQDESAAAALHSIRVALEKAEAANPGLTHELVDGILESEQAKRGMDSTEKLLRAAKNDIAYYQFEERTAELGQLSKKANKLKEMLSSIPDEVADRKAFLGTVRRIADAIKELLDAVNAVTTNNADLVSSHVSELQHQRKIFIRGSKSFSETLKRYFKDGKQDNLYRSAHRLINLTNSLMRTVKSAIESK